MRSSRQQMQLSADLLDLTLQPGAAAHVHGRRLVPPVAGDGGRGEGRLGLVQSAHGDGLQVVEQVVGVGTEAHQALQAS